MFRLCRASSIALLSIFLFAPALDAEMADSGANKPAIPPGQEKLLLEMVGNDAWLPEGCKLAWGHVQYTVAYATYRCPWGETELEFAHIGEIESPDAQTEQFAIRVKKGSAPINLADVVAEYIRSREDEFEWDWPGLEDSADIESDADQ